MPMETNADTRPPGSGELGIVLEEGSFRGTTMSMNQIPTREAPMAPVDAEGSPVDARPKARSAATVAVLGQDGVATIAAPLGLLEGEAMRSDLGRLASLALAVPLSSVRWQASAGGMAGASAAGLDDRELRAALTDAGKKLQRALIALATVTQGSPLHGFPAAALEAHGGMVRPRRGGAVSMSYGEILRLARKSEIRAHGEASVQAIPSPAFWAAHRIIARPTA